MIYPPTVRPGDRIAVIAPSGPFDQAQFSAGLELLKSRYEVCFEADINERQGFLAGSDTRRRGELNRALRAPDVRAVVAARGGYGLGRIIDAVDFQALVKNPKWLVGFSDFTLLHLAAARFGLASIHAPNVTGLGRATASQQVDFMRHLEAPTNASRYDGLVSWHAGTAQGRLFGGNLSLLSYAATAQRLQVPSGVVLIIEDVAESPYRVDRMLTALISRGLLDRVAAVVVGEFSASKPGPHGVHVHDVLRERLGLLRVPVLQGLPLGHGELNCCLTLGLNARVDGTGSVEIIG